MHLKIVRNRIFVVRIVHNFRHDVEPWLVDDLFKSELKKLMKDKKKCLRSWTSHFLIHRLLHQSSLFYYFICISQSTWQLVK